eukprot:4848084-Alexandrium_andersonii.AAC.1
MAKEMLLAIERLISDQRQLTQGGGGKREGCRERLSTQELAKVPRRSIGRRIATERAKKGWADE